MTATVRIERDGAAAWVILDRPDRLNALDEAMSRDLAAAMAAVAADPAIRAVGLRGAGGTFMAGGDIAAFGHLIAETDPGVLEARMAGFVRAVHRTIEAIAAMDKPVLAVVSGAAAGFGVSLMAACDLAIAAEDAVFTLAYCHIGASPDGGATFHLPRLIGLRRSLELALLGDRFDGLRAAEIGLVNRAVPAAELDAESAALLARLAAGPTAALGRARRLLRDGFDVGLPAQLEAEAEAFGAAATGADFREGVAAFLAKRRPVFSGR